MKPLEFYNVFMAALKAGIAELVPHEQGPSVFLVEGEMTGRMTFHPDLITEIDITIGASRLHCRVCYGIDSQSEWIECNDTALVELVLRCPQVAVR